MNAQDFKQAARRFASGVTVVTTRRDREIHGITASAFVTLSLDPLQVLVSINAGSRLHGMILESGHFAINVLREEQRAISHYFASPSRPTCIDEFPEIACRAHVTGAPVLEDCLAHFDCRLAATYPGGDHTIFIGDVLSAAGGEGAPLLYFDGDYRGMRDWGAHSAGNGVAHKR
ncbi:MAG: flavin reductase family protein [Dehalococcoidia bacterium]